MNRHDIILVNPPYSTIGSPYISIPVLCSYLKQGNIDVFPCDLDAMLYKELARPRIVRQGIEHVKKRFITLNARDILNYAEALEYQMFSTLLFQLSLYGDALSDFVRRDYSFDDFKEVRFNKLLITASSALSFPEMIVTVPKFAVNPLFDSASVADIFNSLSDSNGIVDILYRAIDAIMDRHDSPIWGISVPFQEQIIKAFQCAAYIRKKRPGAFIVMGGPTIAQYFRNLPDNRLFSIVDAFAYHEGEVTLKTLVDVIKNRGSLHSVPGIGFKEGDSFIVTTPPEPIPINLSAVPDYDALDLDSYLRKREDMTVPFRLTKGCAWGRCTFCTSFHSGYQQIDPDIILEQLLNIYHHAGIRKFMFSDEASPLPVLDYLAEKIIELGLSVSWLFHTRLTRKLTQERCDLYARAGCVKAYIGIESVSDRILEKMDKGITVAQIEEFFDGFEPKLPIGAYMMVGFPGETEDEAEKSFRYMSALVERKKLASLSYSQFVVKPGSAIWANPEVFGIRELSTVDGRDLDHNIYDFKTDGMPLEKIYEHVSRYSGGKKLEQTLSKIKTITFEEIDEPLNFSMGDVMFFVTSNISFFYKPIREWFSDPSTLSRSETLSW